jgi:type II secretory ATPase GspE/PulE/Tfp pilus assembly ATPase PilB-like protein
MTASPELSDAIEGELDAEELEGVAMGTGMHTLRETCLDLVMEGVTTFDEFVRLKL